MNHFIIWKLITLKIEEETKIKEKIYPRITPSAPVDNEYVEMSNIKTDIKSQNK